MNIQQLRAQISALQDTTMNMGMRTFRSAYDEGKFDALTAVDALLDSLQEEPVSEDLEEAAKHYLYSNILYDDVYVGNPTDKDCIEMFKAGAKWQFERVKEVLLSEVLPCFMHGGEADEVVAELDEVLNKKK